MASDTVQENIEDMTTREGYQDRFMSLNNLALAVLHRYWESDRMEDLEEAITSYREALAACPFGHPDRSMTLNTLANAVLTRYQQLGGMDDLEEVISSHREALTLHPPGHQDRSMSLNNLAIGLLERYGQLGRMEDLDEAITYSREALTLRPPGHPKHSMSLNTLGNAVLTRYEKFGRMEDLEEVIRCNREALSLHPLGHPNRSASLNNLGNAVLNRYWESGRTEDLEEAIISYREALTLGQLNRSMTLSNLALAVLTRYRQSGRMEDLEEAITFHREALTLRPVGHPDRSTSLGNLASAVFTRYKQLARIEDLEDAIAYDRAALTLRPLGHPHHASSLNNLANAVLARYEKLGRMEDLEEAITSHREALSLRPLDDPHRSSSLNNLAIAILTRYEQLDRMEDLEEVIAYNREALTLRPLGHPNRPNSLNNLATAVSYHYTQVDRLEDLEEVITYNREALTLRPLDHPDRSASLKNLANSILTRYQQSGRMEDLEESFMLYEQAVNHVAASAQQRFTIAILWANLAQRYRHSSIIRAHSIALHLLNRCLFTYPRVDSQQRFLATVQIPKSLPSDAASAAISHNNLELAVELLEQGRAILWSRMAGYRYSLDQLRQVDAPLADKLETLSGQLECLALSSESGPMDSEIPTSPAHVDAQMQRSRILSEEWEQTVEQIRKIKEFSNFLRAVPFTTLKTAAAEGPIVIINISSHRSDAIILHIDKPPTLVALPNVNPQHLAHLGEQLASARHPSGVDNASNLIQKILRDLWTGIVSPVHDCLTRLGVPEKSRIWWCPTSELCALPLHAAGPYRPQQKNLPDIYTSSYIPTISALVRARRDMIDQPIVPKLLLIAQPGETVPSIQVEIDNVRQLGDFVDVIVGADANCDTALRALQQHTWAHFACRGRLGDNGQPFHASFELDGGNRLTLLDLMQAKLPNAELAFLSVCHTAAGGSNTPDETIHLAAALQFCGFRSVVGTLWEMVDADGPVISKEFYKYMLRKPGNKADFRDSAEALNLAIRSMEKNGVPLERWVMFVHIGA